MSSWRRYAWDVNNTNTGLVPDVLALRESIPNTRLVEEIAC